VTIEEKRNPEMTQCSLSWQTNAAFQQSHESDGDVTPIVYRSQAVNMRYFVPDICAASEMPPETREQDKFGGVPFGLRQDKWPKCRDCGKSQSLLAQLVHHPTRLDLGRTGRVLFVFQCNHNPGMCKTWDAHSGANSCIVVEPEQLGHRLTELPGDRPTVENEVRVLAWIEKDDGLPGSLAPAFFSSDSLNKLSNDLRQKVTTGTRLGGVPYWIQSPEEGPGPNWQFAGQLDGTYNFLRPPTIRHAWISDDPNRWEGRTHVGQGPNFGDGGIAYLFLHEVGGMPECCAFWQCS
jgi:hypothetical protein